MVVCEMHSMGAFDHGHVKVTLGSFSELNPNLACASERLIIEGTDKNLLLKGACRHGYRTFNFNHVNVSWGSFGALVSKSACELKTAVCRSKWMKI